MPANESGLRTFQERVSIIRDRAGHSSALQHCAGRARRPWLAYMGVLAGGGGVPVSLGRAVGAVSP